MDIIKLAERFSASAAYELKQIPPADKRSDVNDKIYLRTRPSGTPQFYIKNKSDSKAHYIRKSQNEILFKMYELKFNTTKREILENNIAALSAFKNTYIPYDEEHIVSRTPKAYLAIKKILDTQHASNYSYDPIVKSHYAQSEKATRREGLIHTTAFGLKTRSKGEAMIAGALHAAEIPFQYEKRLELYGLDASYNSDIPEYYRRDLVAIYPDFTIDLGNDECIYWEHRGLMDNDFYSTNDYWRTLLYFRNEIYQPVNLILTADGPDGSTDMEAITRIINGLIKPLL